jgi:hypothetical protein
MTKKQGISIGIIAAILTGVFMYLVFYFPHELVEGMFWVVSVAFCFGCFYLIVALIWTKGEILPNPYPNFYLPDPDIYLGEKKRKEGTK